MRAPRDRASPGSSSAPLHPAALGRLAHVGALDAHAPRLVARRDIHRPGHRPHPAAPARPLGGGPCPASLRCRCAWSTCPPSPISVTPYGQEDQVDVELEVLGMDVTGHLMDRYRPLPARLGVTPPPG